MSVDVVALVLVLIDSAPRVLLKKVLGPWGPHYRDLYNKLLSPVVIYRL